MKNCLLYTSYDAQPVCCNDCGPEVYLIGRSERGRDAITYTRQVIHDGGIAVSYTHLIRLAASLEAVVTGVVIVFTV